MEKVPAKIWYLPGPMFQYNEDVKALARQAGLKIVDANVSSDRTNAGEDVPEVTIKAEYIGQDADERMPTKAELLTAYEQLQGRERELDEREKRLVDAKERIEALGAANEEAAARNAEQAAANEAEARRLRDEAAQARAVAVTQVVATESKAAKAKAA